MAGVARSVRHAVHAARRRGRLNRAEHLQARFFLALRPDARAAAELARLAARLAAALGGRPLSAHDVHLTLVFVGARPVDEATSLRSLLDGIAPHWPGLPLTRLGSFGRGLWWVGPADTPAWPVLLADQLRQRLREAGIGFDERALHLHATLLRGARPDAKSALAAFADDLPIVAEHWSLALGGSGANSTPQRRYCWIEAPG